MYQAPKLQFAPVIDEFVRWRAIPADDRPAAPSWWWGPAMQVRDFGLKLPPGSAARMGLPDDTSYAAGAKLLFRLLAGQPFQPWPYDFSPVDESTGSDLTDLHTQPSDDSAVRP